MELNTMLDVSDHFRNALGLTFNYGDPSTDLERVLEDDPKKNMAVAQGLILVLSNDASSFEKAKQLLADINLNVELPR